MRRLSAVAFIFLTLLGTQAEAQSKRAVFVAHSGDDVVGRGLAYAVREELRRSAAYEAAAEDQAVYQIRIISIDDAVGSQPEGISSAISVVYTMTNYVKYVPKDPQTWYPIFLTAKVLSLGRNRIDAQAKSVVATLDQEVEDFLARTR
jgi:hypothetical protein